MISTSMYWLHQLAAQQRQVHYFIQTQQDKEILLNTLTYSINYLLKDIHLAHQAFPWEHSTMYEENIIEYKAQDPRIVFITIHTPKDTVLHAELFIEYLSNNKKRCTIQLIP